MTTKDLIDWSLKLAELCRSDHPRPDLADMHEAIAARLKALEEMREKARKLAQLGFDIDRNGEVPDAELFSDILDTVRELEK